MVKYKEWLTPEKLNLIRNWKMNGLTNEEVAKSMGIARSILYEWQNRFPELKDALKTGKAEANAIVENKLFQKAVKGNMTAIIFYLKNNMRDKYNDSQIGPEERELVKQRIKKEKAQAAMLEEKAKALKEGKGQFMNVVFNDDLSKTETNDDE